MKVFNWVHRRFLHVRSCPAYPQDNGLERCSVRSKADAEKHALLEHGGHVQLVDVLDEWNDGILAIGTLAIGPLDTTNYCTEIVHDDEDDHVENHLSVHDDDDHDHVTGDDDFEVSPLIKMALFSHELEKVEDELINGSCKNEEEVIVGDGGVVINDELKGNNEICQIKRRVTLADLFSEDSDHHLVKKLNESTPDDDVNNIIIIRNRPRLINMKPAAANCHAKVNGLCKAKKFLKEELSPIRKLNQLMKRMMKKKIHPDLEGKMQKKDTQMQLSNGLQGIPTNHQNELASLLLIPDSKA